MPIFEYVCTGCGAEFELLVREGTTIACASCGSKQIEKKMSVFSAQESRPPAPPPCAGGCGGGFQQGQCSSGMCGLG